MKSEGQSSNVAGAARGTDRSHVGEKSSSMQESIAAVLFSRDKESLNSVTGTRPEERGTFDAATAVGSNDTQDWNLIRPAYDLKVPCVEVGIAPLETDESPNTLSFRNVLGKDTFDDISLGEEPDEKSRDNIPVGKPVSSQSNCCTGVLEVVYSWAAKILADSYDKCIRNNSKRTP